MTEPKNIDEVILLIQQDMPTLVKDKAGQVGAQKTKYADLVQVNRQVLPRLVEHGVTYVCLPNMQDDGKFALEYELLHLKSGTAKRGKYPLKLAENPMQMGSAITYARRYALLSVLGVVAEDEDDDGRAAHDGGGTAQRAPRQRGRQPAEGGQTAQRRAPVTAPPLPGDEATISRQQAEQLKAVFEEQGFRDPKDMLAYSSRKAGRSLTNPMQLTVPEFERVVAELTAPPDDTQPPAGAEGGE